MNCQGSKKANATQIIMRLPKAENFIEPFLGGANLTKKIPCLKYKNIFCSDINPYIIAYFEALKQGWLPENNYTEEFYDDLVFNAKKKTGKYPDHLIGYIGHTHSFGGVFLNTFAKSHKKDIKKSKYALNVAVEDKRFAANVNFRCCSYEDVVVLENSVIYCDPPYANTRPYLDEDFDYSKFNSDNFWNWVRKQSEDNMVFVSEYTAPEDFVSICETEKITHYVLRKVKSIEKLFIHNSLVDKYKKII